MTPLFCTDFPFYFLKLNIWYLIKSPFILLQVWFCFSYTISHNILTICFFICLFSLSFSHLEKVASIVLCFFCEKRFQYELMPFCYGLIFRRYMWIQCNYVDAHELVIFNFSCVFNPLILALVIVLNILSLEFVYILYHSNILNYLDIEVFFLSSQLFTRTLTCIFSMFHPSSCWRDHFW